MGVRAQADCGYGFKIYVKDAAGKVIENAKTEVAGLTAKDKLPAAFRATSSKEAYFVAVTYGTPVRGNFLLSVSAEGFETYEWRFNFPVCEVQSFELRPVPKGSTARARFERLLTVHGKVFDEDKKPFGNASIVARSADGRVYQTTSNAYGYFKFDLPKGPAKVRVTGGKIPDVVFDDYVVNKNYSVLNVAVCLKCDGTQPGH
jgi:hypothetical protein